MRNESRERINTNMARVQGYHERTTHSSYGYESYAFQGFRGLYYFNSDRKIKLDENYRRTDGETLKGYGLEIETECSSISRKSVLAEVMEKIVFPKFKFGAEMFKMQDDSSLGGRTSVEIITQIMTKSRIRNDYAAYKAMYDDYFNSFGITADSYHTSCGMHVNVSNALFGKTEEDQIEAIRKLYYIVNRHYDLACRLFYRSPMRTHWCGRMDYSNARNMDIRMASGSHGNCMNLSHFGAGRMEIRLVGGQKDYYCFRNTMESVFHLVERVNTISWADCDDIVKIFQGCNQYVYKRLSTECTEHVTPEQLAAIQSTVKTVNLELHR